MSAKKQHFHLQKLVFLARFYPRIFKTRYMRACFTPTRGFAGRLRARQPGPARKGEEARRPARRSRAEVGGRRAGFGLPVRKDASGASPSDSRDL